jgi:RNA polymerase sigma factor (sigma-70 family)
VRNVGRLVWWDERETQAPMRPAAEGSAVGTACTFPGWLPVAGVMLMMGPELLGRLLDEHAAALVLFARQWCAAPEDVVQEAFVKLAAQRPPPGRVVAWLYRVVRNGAISAGRAERRRRRHEAEAAGRAIDWFLPSEGARLDAEAAAAALQGLPPEQRETVVAHLWGGLTFEQIGELTGVSSSTAHRRYLEALDVLRTRLRVPCRNETKIRP